MADKDRQRHERPGRCREAMAARAEKPGAVAPQAGWLMVPAQPDAAAGRAGAARPVADLQQQDESAVARQAAETQAVAAAARRALAAQAVPAVAARPDAEARQSAGAAAARAGTDCRAPLALPAGLRPAAQTQAVADDPFRCRRAANWTRSPPCSHVHPRLIPMTGDHRESAHGRRARTHGRRFRMFCPRLLAPLDEHREH